MKKYHRLDFECENIIKLLDKCDSCGQREECKYLARLQMILRNKAEIDYKKRDH